MKYLFYSFLIPIAAILFQSCANISPPGGGPKDLKAPVLLKSIPVRNSKNFAGKEIVLQFNERIISNNLQDELIINPAVNGEYKTSIKKNILTITFEKPFEQNTTYTFNFRAGIKDITESNIPKNLQLAFSTGDVLDTVTIEGEVIDLFTNKAIPNALISLYKTGDTATVSKSKPTYFTRSDKTGKFFIYNIKKGNYNIYAFNDINRNYLYDNINEKIAFIHDINLDSANTLFLLPSKNKLGDIRFLNKRIISETATQVNYSNGLVSAKILDKNTYNLYITIPDNGKGIVFYSPKPVNDSVPIIISIEDSLGLVKIDTVNLQFKDLSKGKNEKVKEKVNLIKKISPTDLKLIPGQFNFTIEFVKPITLFNLNKVIVKKDSLSQNSKILKGVWNATFTSISIGIDKKLSFKDSLLLLFPKGTFISIQGDTSSNEKYIFTNKKEEDFAILEGNIKTTSESYILQLVDNTYNVINEEFNVKTFNFNYITPGIYALRVIIDSNKNGKWDAGSIEDNIQPEDIIFYKERFNLRANWEIRGIEFNF